MNMNEPSLTMLMWLNQVVKMPRIWGKIRVRTRSRSGVYIDSNLERVARLSLHTLELALNEVRSSRHTVVDER